MQTTAADISIQTVTFKIRGEEPYRVHGPVHQSQQGWFGIPAHTFRAIYISASKALGGPATHAKLSAFVAPDGGSMDGQTSIVRITQGTISPKEYRMRYPDSLYPTTVRTIFGFEWDPGWEAAVRMMYDANRIDHGTLASLMRYGGEYIGIGEGRRERASEPTGYGRFSVIE